MASVFGGMASLSALGVGAAAAFCGLAPVAVPIILIGGAVLWDRERDREEASKQAARQHEVNAMRDTMTAIQAELAAMKAAQAGGK